MRLLSLIALLLSQACIEAPPANQVPTDLDSDMSPSTDLGGDADGPEDQGTSEDMNSPDMLADMPAVQPFTVNIRLAAEEDDFSVSQPLFGSIRDQRLRDMRNVRLIPGSGSPVESSSRREDVIVFWIQIPTQAYDEEMSIIEEPHVDTLRWGSYQFVFHMDGNQNARRSSASIGTISGMNSATGQVGIGARGVGTTDVDWSSGEEFTIMFWFRDISNTGSERLIRFSPSGSAEDFDEFSFELDEGSPIFRYDTGTISWPAYQADADFHHIALVYSGGSQTFEFFVDGTPVGQDSAATPFSGTFEIEIGDSSALDNIFDELWIAKNALTPQEIETIYRNQRGELTISNE